MVKSLSFTSQYSAIHNENRITKEGVTEVIENQLLLNAYGIQCNEGRVTLKYDEKNDPQHIRVHRENEIYKDEAGNIITGTERNTKIFQKLTLRLSIQFNYSTGELSDSDIDYNNGAPSTEMFGFLESYKPDTHQKLVPHVKETAVSKERSLSSYQPNHSTARYRLTEQGYEIQEYWIGNLIKYTADQNNLPQIINNTNQSDGETYMIGYIFPNRIPCESGRFQILNPMTGKSSLRFSKNYKG